MFLSSFGLVYLLNVCKFCIWWARNDFRFRRVRPSAVDVMDRVKARLRFHLPLFFPRLSSDVAAVSLSVSGVLVAILLQSSMAVLLFIFSFLFGIPALRAGLVG